MSEDASAFEGWAILELMGHRRLGGMVTAVEFAGGKFVRLDVPGDEGVMATQLYGASAIYCLTPTTEEMARVVAKSAIVAPVSRWELPRAVDVDQDDSDVDDLTPEDW